MPERCSRSARGRLRPDETAGEVERELAADRRKLLVDAWTASRRAR